MMNRAIAYATTVGILILGCNQYLSTKRLSEVQKQYRRVVDQAETIKAEERKVDSQQQQIKSLQHQLQTQNDRLQVRLNRVEGELRARKELRLETAVAHHPAALRIYPLWISPNGAVECTPTLGPTCDVFELGSNVHIGITLTNTSGHPITYPRWFGPPTFLVVRDESGQIMPEAEEFNKLKESYPPPDDTVLKPDGQVSWGVPVNKYWDMSRPGTYSIIAKLRSDERGQTWFYSNQVRVRITPKH
jgi:hypothetical protein